MNVFEIYRQSKIMANKIYEQLKKDEGGEAPVKALVMVFVIAILAGALLPVGISALKAANTTGWTTGEIATYGVVTVMLIIAVVLLIVRMATE